MEKIGISNSRNIYFYTKWAKFDQNDTAGGPHVIRQHLAILRSVGYDAKLVLAGRARVGPLTRNSGDLGAIGRVAFGKMVRDRDVVLVPAIHAGEIDRIPGHNKIILIQNAAFCLQDIPYADSIRYPWASDSVRALLTVSRVDKRLLGHISMGKPVYRVYNSVPSFHASVTPWASRDNLILVAPPLPYKNPWHANIIAHLLLARLGRSGNGMPLPQVLAVRGLRREHVYALLARAKLLIFPSVVEGFGLLPLEALRAGTPLVCYENQPFMEYMPDIYQFRISDFDSIVEFCARLLENTRLPDDIERARQDGVNSAGVYSEDRQRESVLSVWDDILSRIG